MEYIFGVVDRNGKSLENLKIIGQAHTDLRDFQQVIREYPDCIITDNFRVVEKYSEAEGAEGRTYDWYIIDSHNQYVDRYTPAAAALRQTGSAAAIAFVTLSETGAIDGVTAGEHPEMFAEWEPEIAYTPGNIRRYGEQLYRCLQAHTSQPDWTPDKAVSLWSKIADPAEEWPEWSQPVGAHDAYNTGDRVSHGGKHWTSGVDNNVWEPGIYGWEEVN